MFRVQGLDQQRGQPYFQTGGRFKYKILLYMHILEADRTVLYTPPKV